ncbi:hypothetical protein BU23DRAFT_561027 [Bimuria novae-zelandiae CBS 107.79]|uniref:Uncharacterized protein n=1 Tax=Bimuria novae-zelandiae CBS 107.79 TaxID=1447943 RepID=A0A6A5UL71_9PLEO|nr:hypothetical protein BU23DRAFT_561027 [Bimuria novae-zelandiae CBS 107.79]
MKEFKKYNDCRRVRKRKSQEKHTKLGHPWRVDESTLRALMDDATNPVRDKPLGVQIRTNDIPLTKRALEHNLRTRIHAGVYKQAYTKKEISLDNKYLRPIFGFWDAIYWTDEAHFNPEEDFQKPNILRYEGERLKTNNIGVRKPVKSSPLTLHIYATVNWYYKGPLGFYNDDVNMLTLPKPPQRPRKYKYETWQKYKERLTEWELKCPPAIKGDVGGHHMTQEYYTEHILPSYIDAVQQARIGATIEQREWLLQEDNDPSHGTKSFNNVSRKLKDVNWICTLLHPGQSPDLNPQEGVWLILKQRVKRRLNSPLPPETIWDGTKQHLKETLVQEWAMITLTEIRRLISEMPSRCKQLATNGGEAIRSEHW